MPRKPTSPFGYIAFSKSGRVTKVMHQLSEVKEEQEMQVSSNFVEAYNSLNLGPKLENLCQLGQRDHDAIVYMRGVSIQLQITELVARSYTFEMNDDDYNSGRFTEAVQLSYGSKPHRIDPTLRDEALWRAIEKKIAKSYSPPQNGALWLIVFSNDVLYKTEYIDAGVPAISKALHIARTNLTFGAGPFAEVWFTNLQTRPVRVWPA